MWYPACERKASVGAAAGDGGDEMGVRERCRLGNVRWLRGGFRRPWGRVERFEGRHRGGFASAGACGS